MADYTIEPPSQPTAPSGASQKYTIEPPAVGPEKVYRNDAGQPFTLSGRPPVTPPTDQSYIGSILPLRRDQGGLHLAVPESISSPIKGAIEGGKRALGVGEAGQNPLRPVSPDIMSTLLTSELGRAASGKPNVTDPEQPLDANLPKPVVAASNRLTSRLQETAKGGGPSATDIMDQFTAARAEGQPLTLGDVKARPIRRLAGEVYRGPGAAAAHMEKFFEGRDVGDLAATGQTAGGARMAELNRRYLTDQSRLQMADDLAAARSENAAPLWNQAMSQKPVWSEYVQKFVNEDPDFRRGLAEGWKIERNNALAERRPLNLTDYAIVDFNPAGDPVFGQVPTMRMLQMGKEGLDSVLESKEMRQDLPPFRLTKLGKSVDAKRRAFLDEVDKLNPFWKAAREKWSGDTQSMRALQDGRQLFDRRLTNEEIRKQWDGLSENDRQFYLVGAADRLQQIMGDKALSADESKSILNSDNALQRMRMIFGDREEDFQKYLQSVLRERQMYDAQSDITKGSQTAERVAADSTQGAQHAAHAAGHLAGGNPLGAVFSALRAARDVGARPDPEVNLQIAKMLTDPALSVYLGPGGTKAPTLLRPFRAPAAKPTVGPMAIERFLRDLRNAPSP